MTDQRNDGTVERVVLTPFEAARKFRVDTKTLSRWARAGIIPFFVTPAGHRRYYEDELEAVISKGRVRVK